MKLCIITCYNQPDYIRAKTLRTAARGIDGVEVIEVKNSSTGIVRYLQVVIRVIKARFSDKPDAYLLTFRGYEMLLPVRLLTLGKPLIYDEFINPIEWAIYEHKKLNPNNPLVKLFKVFYKWLTSTVSILLTDTNSHADISADLTGQVRSKFFTIPVGTDEATFAASSSEGVKNDMFTVFYYGNMLPLHGLQYVIDAATKLNGRPAKFVLVGGDTKVAEDVAKAVKNGARIEYKAWVPFKQLPKLMHEADLCLAGPFGATFQADYVITGKAYQYLAMGRPTAVGSNKESDVFTDKKNALVVAQGNSDSLVSAIRWAMDNQDGLRNMGIAGKQLFDSHYSQERLSDYMNQMLAGLGLTKLGAGADSQQDEK